MIVVPFHIRHLGPRQSTVLDCRSKFSDVVNEPLPRALILAHQYADMMESGKFSTVLELAQYLKSDRSHVARTLSLVNLAVVSKNGTAPGFFCCHPLLYDFFANSKRRGNSPNR